MSYKYIDTIQDLIDLLNTVDDKSRSIEIQGYIGMESNFRSHFEHFSEAQIWGNDNGNEQLRLVLS